MTGSGGTERAATSHAEQLARRVGAPFHARSARTSVISLAGFDEARAESIAHEALASTLTIGVDCAALPGSSSWSRFRFLASDMDSTLITIECIDEIADFCGKRTEVAAITEAAMRGEIPNFAESLRRRVGLLKGLPESALARVYEDRLALSPGAIELMLAVRQKGLKTLLVSGGFTYFADRVRERLGMDAALANVLEVSDGHLTGRVLGDIVDGAAKLAALESGCAALGITPANAIVLGDGANDLPMLERAGLSVAYHAKPAVAEAADVTIRFGGLDVLLEWL